MSAKPYRKVHLPEGDLSRMQDAVKASLDSVTTNPLLKGNFLSRVALAGGGTTNVSHGLGRNYLSFLAGNFSAPARLSAGASPDPSKWIAVTSDLPTICDLFVF